MTGLKLTHAVKPSSKKKKATPAVIDAPALRIQDTCSETSPQFAPTLVPEIRDSAQNCVAFVAYFANDDDFPRDPPSWAPDSTEQFRENTLNESLGTTAELNLHIHLKFHSLMHSKNPAVASAFLDKVSIINT